MYDIDWTKIKNGARGFEELAREYVKDVFSFPYGKWEATPTTHDGNKDAYTIIIGFHSNLLENEIWWMEAKYSNEQIYLSRFKLDATIVSSIFNCSVKKIIFVTNIDIKAKVISDVRVALYNGTSCKEAHFCTRKTLEFWLYKNPSVYKNFFNGNIPMLYNSKDLFVSEDISIYSALNTMRDVPSLHTITTNMPYGAHFKIVSNCSQKIRISSAQKEITLLSPSFIDIQQGENALSVYFKIKDGFSNNRKENSPKSIGRNDLCFFRINKNVPVITQYPLTVLENEKTQIRIDSQIRFEQDFRKYKFSQQASFWLIDGTTGCGKTTLIQRCAEEKSIKDINYRYIKFTNNVNSNNLELVATIFFILFPYMYMEDITIEYLETLKISRHLKNILCNFKKYIANEHELINYAETLIAEEKVLYPTEVQINPQIIVLDDIQLLNDINIRFLFFILRTAQRLPIMFVLASHSYFMENSIFKLHKNQLSFEQYHLELTVSDIIENMKSLFSFTFDISKTLIEYFFPNIIIFNMYIRYVTELRNTVMNLNDFILTYISFKQGHRADEYIHRQFTLVSEENIVAWKVCQEIYNYRNGISISDDNKNEIGYLLKTGLVKYNEFNNLIPINDVYLIHYQKRYSDIFNESNPIENMAYKLTNMVLPKELEGYYEKIHTMRNNEEFHTVNYILETVFENTSLDRYKTTWGEELFYLLYFEYTYVAINCNSMITGYDNLHYIYTNIKGTSSTRLQRLLLEVIFELINCDYNNSRYSNCKEYYKIFCRQFSALAKKGDIENDCTKNLFWVLSTGYMLYIDAEEHSKNILEKAVEHRNFLLEYYPFHYIDFCRQFSKVLYFQNWNIACEWQKLAYDAVVKKDDKHSKQALKVSFDFYFTQYLKTEDANYLKKMKEQMAVAKYKIYSSYRHQLFLYCGLLYMLDSIDEADTLFISDVITLRPIRQKMKGHYYLLLSLRSLKHKKIKEAKENIEESIEFFKGLESYERIVLHNHIILKNTPLDKIQFKFCTSNFLSQDTFYLDPRM